MIHIQATAEIPAGAVRRVMPRLGLIVPRSNTTCERELNRACAEICSVHTARMKTVAGSLSEDPQTAALVALREPLEDLALCDVDVAALACTNAAMACSSEALTSLFAEHGRARPVLISESICRALEEADARRIALFTPYTRSSNDAVSAFLAARGFEVVSSMGLGLNTSPERFAVVSQLTQDYLLGQILGMDIGGADTMLISCTDLPTFELVSEVSRRLGIPATSSTLALQQDIERVVAELDPADRG